MSKEKPPQWLLDKMSALPPNPKKLRVIQRDPISGEWDIFIYAKRAKTEYCKRKSEECHFSL